MQKGKSDKVYEVDLCEMGSSLGARRFIVNFRYGCRGGSLREGTKTTDPVERDEAEAIFASVVVGKTNKGYHTDGSQPSALNSPAPEPLTAGSKVLPSDRLIASLQAGCDNRISEQKLSRAIWRAGELRLTAAAEHLAALISRGRKHSDQLRNYCIAWALGRCGNDTHRDSLIYLQTQNEAFVSRMATESWLSLSPRPDRQAVYDEIMELLPDTVKLALNHHADHQALATAITRCLADNNKSNNTLLVNMYILARDFPVAHQGLLSVLRTTPMKPNYFKAIRSIFKTSEFRDDFAMFGLIAYRIETSKPMYDNSNGQWTYIYPEGHIRIQEEIRKSDSRIAYSNRTRNYLRRRVWRTLRRLGEMNHDDYASYAVNVLMPYADGDAGETRRRDIYRWQQIDGRWRSVLVQRNTYDEYAAYLAFNHIIRGASPRYQLAAAGNAWLQLDGETIEGRFEKFPTIWNRQPQALVLLLTQNRCRPVHAFAARALRELNDHWESISDRNISAMLAAPYPVTQALAYDIAKQRLLSRPTAMLIIALANSPWLQARQFVQQWLDIHYSYLDDLNVLIRLAVSPHRDTRLWLQDRLQGSPLEPLQAAITFSKIIAELMGLDGGEGFHQDIVTDCGDLLIHCFTAQVAKLGMEVIIDLLDHPFAPIQALAGKLLSQHDTPAEYLPAEVFSKLMQAKDAVVRSAGVSLFGKLPEQVLLQQCELLLQICRADSARIRQVVQPIIEKLARNNPDFAQELLRELMNDLFRAEPYPGLHDDLHTLFTTALPDAVAKLDELTVWRLLQAKCKAAQKFGALALDFIPATAFSVKQLARLARHAMLAAREYAWRAYQEQPERIHASLADALAIMDTDWEDTRVFAFDYFRRFDAWTPEIIIGICDSVRDDVQRFGRELIGKFFRDSDGAEYMVKLSEHPAQNVQLYVTNYLQVHAAGNAARLHQLQPYFLSVLSQVNRGRAAKNRVLSFLRQEALNSPSAARLVAEMLERLCVTNAIGDKAEIIVLLRDIHLRFPDVPVPISIKPVQTVTE